jgi:uncharacterized protein YciI
LTEATPQSSAAHSVLRNREQCYICWTSYNSSPPPQAKSLDELNHAHHEYLRDLEQRGILFGSGSLQDENGKRAGAGLYIIRARTRAEAEAIAYHEPLVAAGGRTVELTPWQRNGGSITLTVNFANGQLTADTRRFALKDPD